MLYEGQSSGQSRRQNSGQIACQQQQMHPLHTESSSNVSQRVFLCLIVCAVLYLCVPDLPKWDCPACFRNVSDDQESWVRMRSHQTFAVFLSYAVTSNFCWALHTVFHCCPICLSNLPGFRDAFLELWSFLTRSISRKSTQ